jgi:BirA family biotin operon repressor/biotin-[acetyl-CoA-carboxylase] ligase
MNPVEIRNKIHTRSFGQELIFFDSIDSTNRAAKKFAADGAPDGSVILAAEQTEGAGRQGREWISEPGKDLTFSVIVRPGIAPSRLGILSLYASVSVSAAVEKVTGAECSCKWPNDVFLSGRKVAGILSESVFSGGDLLAVIIGIGLNVNRRKFPGELETSATSMSLATGRSFDLGDTLSVLLAELESRYRFAPAGDQTEEDIYGGIIADWTERNSVLGKPIVVEQGELKITGTARSVAEDGSLIVESSGGTHRVVAGDVHIIVPHGGKT